MSRWTGGRSARAVPGGPRRALRPGGGRLGLRRNRPGHCSRRPSFSICRYGMTRRMSEKYNRPVSREDLLFTVEMALRKARKL